MEPNENDGYLFRVRFTFVVSPLTDEYTSVAMEHDAAQKFLQACWLQTGVIPTALERIAKTEYDVLQDESWEIV